MKYQCLIIAVLPFFCLSCANGRAPAPAELTDHDYQTHFTGKKGVNKILFEQEFNLPVLSYQIISSGELPQYDPVEWCFKGSNDGKNGPLWINESYLFLFLFLIGRVCHIIFP